MPWTIEHIYSILSAISSVIILTLSFLMAKIHLDQFQELRKVRLYLSLSYFILGISGLITYSMGEKGIESALLILITIGVASSQSLLFTIVHLVLIQAKAFSRSTVLKQISAIALIITILLIVHFNGLVLNSVVVIVAIGLYLAQQIHYVSRFDRQYQEKVKQATKLNEEGEKQLKSVQYSFYGALCIGLLSLFASIGGLTFYVAFIILYTVFYTYMVIKIYNSRFVAVSSCILPEEPETAQEEIPQKTEMDEVKQKIERWVAEKGFLQNDLSVDEMAAMLGTDRRTLRNYFRTEIKTDFRTWRSQLRIEEAKKLLLSHPDSPVSQIGEMVGYNHRSNFFTQFTKVTGENPTVWREEHLQR